VPLFFFVQQFGMCGGFGVMHWNYMSFATQEILETISDMQCFSKDAGQSKLCDWKRIAFEVCEWL
jgi:hypothetical protein